jgi:hypothetical protein
MSNQSLGNRVQGELEQAVASGLLPDYVQDKAEKLLARLQQPVRLALMGMPGAGKSTLVNLLVGKDVMQEGVRLPTMQLSYGDVAQTVCTLPDGTKKTLNTSDLATIVGLSPVFVEMQMPLPALRKISILEVVAPNEQDAVHRASQWAAKRCDVALWCTRSFIDAEQQIWLQMPDIVKDHAFCLMTRADVLKANGLFETALGAVNATAKDEFNQVLAIGTKQAIASRRSDGTVDKDMMRESGGSALISAVLKQVEQGRQSAVDMADILLHQHADLLKNLPPVEAKQQSVPVEVAPAAPAPATDAVSRLRDMAAAKAAARKAEQAPDEPEPAPVELEEPEAAPAPDPVTPTEEPEATAALESIKPETRAAYQHVIDYIEDQGHGLSAAMDDMGDNAPSEVIAMTVEHIQWLCDYLNENGDESDFQLQRIRSTAYDAADLVQLMQMEKRDSAALEAVSLMLQIKRELQADLAA